MFQIFRFTLVAPFLLFVNFVNAAESLTLTIPDFSENKIINKKMGMEFFYKCSPQLKPEIHYPNEKPVILLHSYGYGEVGWTYAPGVAELAYENLQKAYDAIGKKPVLALEKVVVLGAGVNGLMIASKMAKAGYSVTIYSENFYPNTATSMYAGVFMPFLHHQQNEDELMERIEIASYKTYENWANAKNFSSHKGVVPVDLYVINDQGSFNFLMKKGFITEPNLIDVNFGSDKNVTALKYQSFLLDTSIIMKELMDGAKKKGVQFVKKRIEDLRDSLDLGASVIFNCTRLGSNEVFEDINVASFVGHIVSIQNTAEINYAMYVNHLDGTYTYWLPNNDKMVVAGTFLSFNQQGLPESIKLNRLFERVRKLLTNQEY